MNAPISMKLSQRRNYPYVICTGLMKHRLNENHIKGLMHKRRNSIANALELRLFCIKPSPWYFSPEGYGSSPNNNKTQENTNCVQYSWQLHNMIHIQTFWLVSAGDVTPGPTFIKPDQPDPWIKDQIKITLLPQISHLLLPNFVSCGRACPSHMTQNLVTVGAELWTAERFLVDPWSMDYADPVW